MSTLLVTPAFAGGVSPLPVKDIGEIAARFYQNPQMVNNIGDPFILPAQGKFYMYATSGSIGYYAWESEDLCRQINDKRGDHAHNAASQLANNMGAFADLQKPKTGSQSQVLGVGNGDGGPHKVIPSAGEGKQRNHRQNRAKAGQNNLQVCLPGTCAVNGSRLVQFLGHPFEEVADQEDIKHAGHPWEDNGWQLIQPLQCVHDLEQGHQAHHVGEHGKAENRPEDGLLALKVQPLIRKSGGGGYEKHQQHLACCHDEGVFHPA